jgi:hypothetical protein
MPIPYDAHYVRGNSNRVNLANGETVTRAYARTLGAQNMGYKNEHDYRKHYAKDRNYMNAFFRTEQGQRVQERNKEMGRSQRELEQKMIGARNGRPRPTKGKAGNDRYTEFMDEYEFESDGIVLDIDSE